MRVIMLRTLQELLKLYLLQDANEQVIYQQAWISLAFLNPQQSLYCANIFRNVKLESFVEKWNDSSEA